MAVDVNFGVEQQSSTATIRVGATQYFAWSIHSTVEIMMGFAGIGGGVMTVFVGEVEDTDTKFMPYFVEVKASGWLKRAQRQAGNTDPLSGSTDPIIEWNNATDSQIWSDLMKLANVPRYYSGDGDSRTIVGPIKLMPGDNIRGKIDELDHASESGQMTFEWAGQVYRIAALRIPMGTPVWRYAEG